MWGPSLFPRWTYGGGGREDEAEIRKVEGTEVHRETRRVLLLNCLRVFWGGPLLAGLSLHLHAGGRTEPHAHIPLAGSLGRTSSPRAHHPPPYRPDGALQMGGLHPAAPLCAARQRVRPTGQVPPAQAPHLGPLHDAVQAEVMGTALWCPHSLVPESVETNGAALRLIIGVK